MTESYRTVGESGSSEFVVRGSTFIGHVQPVSSVEAAESFVDDLDRQYDDATHTVPAYRVRRDATATFLREYSSDDGEPTGSAGKPALNVLAQQGLENCVAVVTRYYGGTNLGVGGLVRAYSRAVSEAVEDAGIVEEIPHERIRLTVAYDDSGTVRSIIESEGYEFDATYESVVTFDVRVPLQASDEFRDRLRSATSDRIELS